MAAHSTFQASLFEEDTRVGRVANGGSIAPVPEAPPAEVAGIEGFPEGEWGDLWRLSRLPDYAAFPNPTLSAFVADGSLTDGVPTAEPYAVDVEEGKNDPYYGTFNYHTKVPPLAIARYILHYTRPGDVVLDCFCGSGMTGLAATLCGAWPRDAGPANGVLGERRAVLIDLSPIATFLSYAFTRSVDGNALIREAEQITRELRQELGHLYRVPGTDGEIDYVVWSDIFLCSSCSQRMSFWHAAIDPETLEQRDELICPSCGAQSGIRDLERAVDHYFDPVLRSTTVLAAEQPVRLFFTRKTNNGRKQERHERCPTSEDLHVALQAADWPDAHLLVPSARVPDGYNTSQPRQSHRVEFVHQFYTWRSLRVLAWLHQRVKQSPEDLEPLLQVIVLALHARASRRNRNIPKYGHRHVGVLSGTLYIPPLREEGNLIEAFLRRAKKAGKSLGARRLPRSVRISTQSATDLRNLPSDSIDYCFIDPPFGGNIMYSELNFLWEAWFRVRTNASPEAIVSDAHAKTLWDYQELMRRSFREIHRVLKPGHWLTVEFHNSQNSVWVAIQEALWASGFVVADVRVLDKKKGTIKQLSTVNAAKHDLIVSAYKPVISLTIRDENISGSSDVVWAFVRDHLDKLPVWVDAGGEGELIGERTRHVLFDRMVAFHVQRGMHVPLGTQEFYAGLVQRFAERDGMYFLPQQIPEYERNRIRIDSLRQLDLFILDEASAIEWLRRELSDKPQTFQDIHARFTKDSSRWQRHERTIDLKELLEQSFLRYDGSGPVPPQIHSYLSSNYKDLRGLAKDDPRLKEKAKDRWYVPDPNKQGDLEKLRERTLLKEFEEYKSSKKKLRQFRTEAVRAGFKAAYDRQDYRTIVEVADKIPESVLQEDEKLLMYYDVATMRLGA